jgi:hypothetical protein
METRGNTLITAHTRSGGNVLDTPICALGSWG